MVLLKDVPKFPIVFARFAHGASLSIMRSIVKQGSYRSPYTFIPSEREGVRRSLPWKFLTGLSIPTVVSLCAS